jgi:hypothetical protein
MKRSPPGQTLAEFAISLPVLLLLVFGIIEFGRAFQAWITMQNALRRAIRYATTGQYNQTLYPLNTSLGVDDPDSIVPCVDETNPSSRYFGQNGRGFPTTYQSPDGGPPVQVYEGGVESVFATWYGGKDCDPRSPEDQGLRVDLARILSIMAEARLGMAGTQLGPDPLADVTFSGMDQPWYKVWTRPPKDSGGPGWLDVLICSTRPRLDPASTTALPSSLDRRFFLDLHSDPPPSPTCAMNELPPVNNAGGATRNPEIPWLDPGGPGDAVTIVLTFNHPLVTPLGYGIYLQLQVRRTAINESFRPAPLTYLPPIELPQSGGHSLPPTPSQPPVEQPSPLPSETPAPRPTDTPQPYQSPTDTLTPSITFTPSETATGAPPDTITPTVTLFPTRTPWPPTSTPTPGPSPTASRTLPPPTATPTPTPTHVPTIPSLCGGDSC